MIPPKRIARKVLATVKNYKRLTKNIVVVCLMVTAVREGREDVFD